MPYRPDFIDLIVSTIHRIKRLFKCLTLSNKD